MPSVPAGTTEAGMPAKSVVKRKKVTACAV